MYRALFSLLCALAFGGVSAPVFAQQSQTIVLQPVAPGGPGTGTAVIADNPRGPDALVINVGGLQPNRDFTVVLSDSPAVGALPGPVVGKFRTDFRGLGAAVISAEVVDAFASMNPNPDPTLPEGAINGGAVRVALDFIRIYEANADFVFLFGGTNPVGGSVFGTSENVAGGRNVLTGATPIQPSNDPDLDGVPTAIDNCPLAPNPSQLDTNGNGEGDACRCGDVTGDGLVTADDPAAISVFASGGAQLANIGNCDVDGNMTCNQVDANFINFFALGQGVPEPQIIFGCQNKVQ